MSFEYIVKHYNVPAEYGREVDYRGRRGYIVKDLGQYVGVTFHDESASRVRTFHPTAISYADNIGSPRKMTRSQKRYARYLDLDIDLSFGEWLKQQQ